VRRLPGRGHAGDASPVSSDLKSEPFSAENRCFAPAPPPSMHGLGWHEENCFADSAKNGRRKLPDAGQVGEE